MHVFYISFALQMNKKWRFTMKILKAGSFPTITANVSCRFCKAELEIVPSDVHKNKADFPAYPDAYYYRCPCCYRTNYLNISNFSEDFRYEIFKL